MCLALRDKPFVHRAQGARQEVTVSLPSRPVLKEAVTFREIVLKYPALRVVQRVLQKPYDLPLVMSLRIAMGGSVHPRYDRAVHALLNLNE